MCEECEDAEVDVQPLPGGVMSLDGGGSEAAGLLLEMIAGMARLIVLMRELTPDEFELVSPRLDQFLGMFDHVPQTAVQAARPTRAIGFAPVKRGSRAKKR